MAVTEHSAAAPVLTALLGRGPHPSMVLNALAGAVARHPGAAEIVEGLRAMKDYGPEYCAAAAVVLRSQLLQAESRAESLTHNVQSARAALAALTSTRELEAVP